MKRTLAIALGLVIVLALAVFAATQAKSYQVTGPVLTINGDVITVQKGDDKWELMKNADTEIIGKLAVGTKVRIDYKMVAVKITEVK